MPRASAIRRPAGRSVRDVAVRVAASDALTAAGIVATLRPEPGLRLVAASDAAGDSVLVLGVTALDGEARRRVEELTATADTPVVLVVDRPLGAVEGDDCGAEQVVARADATAAVLVAAVRGAATGEHRVRPSGGARQPQLSEREITVLRLAADGLDTAEIAHGLGCSSRTVKNVVQQVTQRLGLRNRTHAVAWALRRGLL